MKKSHKLFLKVLVVATLLIVSGALFAMAGSRAVEILGIVFIVLGMIIMFGLYLWW